MSRRIHKKVDIEVREDVSIGLGWFAKVTDRDSGELLWQTGNYVNKDAARDVATRIAKRSSVHKVTVYHI